MATNKDMLRLQNAIYQATWDFVNEGHGTWPEALDAVEMVAASIGGNIEVEEATAEFEELNPALNR